MRIGQFNRSISEILEDFSKPVPPHKLSQKDAYERDRQTGKSRKSGKKITYVHWYDLIETLLEICPGYSWEVRSRTDAGREIIEGKLTIRAKEGEFIYESVGTEDLDSNSFGDAANAAEASALRRAMAKAGYGLELWRKEVRQNAPEISREDSANPLYSQTISTAQAKRLWTIANNNRYSQEQMRSILGNYGYESTKDILQKDYDKIIKAIS
jgi:hypothetical protein